MRHKNVTKAIQRVPAGQQVSPVVRSVLKTSVPVDFARNNAMWRCVEYVHNNGSSHEPTYEEMTSAIPLGNPQQFYIQANSGRIADSYHAQYHHKMYSIRVCMDQPGSLPIDVAWPGQLAVISDDGSTKTVEYSTGTDPNTLERVAIDLATGKYYDLHILTYTGTAGYRFVMAIDLASLSVTTARMDPLETKIAVLKQSETASLAAGDGWMYMRVPAEMDSMKLASVGACVYTASSSGAISIMVHNATDTVDMLSTALTIDANETDSKDAATPAVVHSTNNEVATGDKIRIDVDNAGTGAKGLEVNLCFRRG